MQLCRSCPQFHDTSTCPFWTYNNSSTRPHTLDLSVTSNAGTYLKGLMILWSSKTPPHSPEKHMKPDQGLLLHIIDWTFLASSRLRWAARPRSTQAFNFARYLEVSVLAFPSIQLSKGESKFDGKITQFMFMYLWIQVWKCFELGVLETLKNDKLWNWLNEKALYKCAELLILVYIPIYTPKTDMTMVKDHV